MEHSLSRVIGVIRRVIGERFKSDSKVIQKVIRRVIRAGRGRGAARRPARLEIPPRHAKSDSQSDSQSDSNSDWGVGSRVIESDSKVIQIVIGQSDSSSFKKKTVSADTDFRLVFLKNKSKALSAGR